MYDEAETGRPGTVVDASDYIVDIREYDVPYHVRVAIDKGRTDLEPIGLQLTMPDIRIGKWYMVEAKHGVLNLECL